jgi:serine O-acetyltransferase
MEKLKISVTLSHIFLDYKRLRNKEKKGSFFKYMYLFVSNAGFRAILLYRLGRYFYLRKIPLFPGFCQRLMHHLCHCWINVSAKIGPGFLIAHVGGIVIGGSTIIGKNCDIRQNVTFGGNFNKTSSDSRTQPVLGDNVSVCPGAVIVGPITIGSNSIIGANSVVTSNIPENVIVSGIPAKIIKERWDQNERFL